MSGRLPLIGHMMKFLMLPDKNFHMPIFMEATEKYGKTVRFEMPINMQVIHTVDPVMIKHFISKPDEGVYLKGDRMKVQFQDFFGDGIFNVDMEPWKWHRSIAAYLFHTSKLKGAIPIFHRNAQKLFDKIEKLRHISPDGIDMQDYFMRYTLDSFAEIGFGAELNSIDQDVNHFAIAFDYVQTWTNRRGRLGSLWQAKEKILPPTEFRKHLNYMNEYVLNIINEKRSLPRAELEQQNDLLSQLLLQDGEDAKHYTDQMLRDFVMNFLIAGRDTTAMLLTWTIYMLSEHPEEEEKVLEEMEATLGAEFEPTWKNQKDLRYLKMVLQETLRLYPPVPADGYQSVKDDVAPGNIFIEKNTGVFYSSYVLHRQPDLWPEPLKFKPERFTTPPKPYTFLPFHGGPRQCMGMEMAYLEAKIILCLLLRRFKLRIHKGHEVKLKSAIILTALGGLPCDV
eukprot:CAMPEP_0114624528 /NCGR_PEP_ID=MMETSP0168-20121206/10811_1 /TAXON_ID=95228 ORGANISM="Vannella sp., Strain DIVA3 517/6/12" /NCGR_SAMPLE_ID=MMETSP0168 /ASSEMBLY_ACC=CAM_ASM_000044 /LENGTH=451 /DNA_ID=CAMNT_0001835801 /DNA_START=81 /DNA_END=1432 /DNA_ORIENTATION=-